MLHHRAVLDHEPRITAVAVVEVIETVRLAPAQKRIIADLIILFVAVVVIVTIVVVIVAAAAAATAAAAADAARLLRSGRAAAARARAAAVRALGAAATRRGTSARRLGGRDRTLLRLLLRVRLVFLLRVRPLLCLLVLLGRSGVHGDLLER